MTCPPQKIPSYAYAGNYLFCLVCFNIFFNVGA